jgi:hypothetical protein
MQLAELTISMIAPIRNIEYMHLIITPQSLLGMEYEAKHITRNYQHRTK